MRNVIQGNIVIDKGGENWSRYRAIWPQKPGGAFLGEPGWKVERGIKRKNQQRWCPDYSKRKNDYSHTKWIIGTAIWGILHWAF